jgi:antitoxin component YwqK of YwqJK toxin-antitoxin module
MNQGAGDMLEIDEYSWIKGTLKYKLTSASGRNRSEALGYHPNGKLKFRYFLVNNELNGVGRFWDEEGRLYLEESYVNAKLHGTRRQYYPAGALESEESYKDNQRNGIAKSWYPDGSKKREAIYLSGSLHGICLEWHSNGQISERKKYEGGFINGVCMKWDSLGKQIEKKVYVRGVIVPPKIQEIINSGALTAQYVLSIKNTALRRICLEELGYERFLMQVKHEIISQEGEYELIRINWYKREESIYLVKVKCPSTGAFYTLRVPPKVKTVKEAVAWTFNVKESEYVLTAET